RSALHRHALGVRKSNGEANVRPDQPREAALLGVTLRIMPKVESRRLGSAMPFHRRARYVGRPIQRQSPIRLISPVGSLIDLHDLADGRLNASHPTTPCALDEALGLELRSKCLVQDELHREM